MWSSRSLSHSCAPKTCLLKNKFRPNLTYQSRQLKLLKNAYGVNIESNDVFKLIISWPAPPPPVPFVFSSTLVEKKKIPLKASMVLNKVAPSSATSSSNSTKSTKNPRTRPHLPNHHQTNLPPRVLVNNPLG